MPRHKISKRAPAGTGVSLGVKRMVLCVRKIAIRKATISFVISVCPFFRMEQLGSCWTDFDEIWYLSIFRKSVEKIQVSLKSDKSNGYIT